MEYSYSSNQELEIKSMSIAWAGGVGELLVRLSPSDDPAVLEERLSAFRSAINLQPLRGYEG